MAQGRAIGRYHTTDQCVLISLIFLFIALRAHRKQWSCRSLHKLTSLVLPYNHIRHTGMAAGNRVATPSEAHTHTSTHCSNTYSKPQSHAKNARRNVRTNDLDFPHTYFASWYALLDARLSLASISYQDEHKQHFPTLAG